MHFKSKTTTLVILGITAIISSRILLALYNDPEGGNLLVSAGFALVIYVVSIAAYKLSHSMSPITRLVLSIIMQIVSVIILYFCLK